MAGKHVSQISTLAALTSLGGVSHMSPHRSSRVRPVTTSRTTTLPALLVSSAPVSATVTVSATTLILTTMVTEYLTVMTLTHVTMITMDGTIHGKIPAEPTQLMLHQHLLTQTATVWETQVV